MKKLLHVGCGYSNKQHTSEGFNTDEWKEIRFDINPLCKPDIVGTITDMKGVADGSVDAIFSAHNIEHLYAHEVDAAFREFVRVLAPDGFAVIACPDLVSVCKLVIEGKLLKTAYESPAGPIAPIDILYGHRGALEEGHTFMAHKCGFTSVVLTDALVAAGFATAGAVDRPTTFDLLAIATKKKHNKKEAEILATRYFPR